MERPLSGVRIIDLTRALAGPFGSMILADLGAEVIKLEPPEGDSTRRQGPDFHHGESIYYCSINRNKKGIVLDMRSAEGKAVFYDLVRASDVVCDNFRAGVTERLGIDYATLSQLNPRIISCSLSGFRADGPYRDRPAFDLAIQAMAGAMSLTGEPDGKPMRLGIPMGDLAGGVFSAHAILAALYQRERIGRGQKVELTLLDSLLAMLSYQAACYLASGVVPKAVGTGHASTYPLATYLTKDDQWIAIVVGNDDFWRPFCRAIEMPELVDDPRYAKNARRSEVRAELHPIFEQRFRERTLDEWMERMDEAGVPAGPVNRMDRALADPEIAEGGMITRFEHPLGGTVRAIGSPLRFSESERTYAPPPLLGEHSVDVLRDVLNYSPARIAELLERKIVRGHE